MLKKDKVWFEIRLGLHNLSKARKHEAVYETTRMLQKDNDGSVEYFVIPTDEKETMIHLLYDPNGNYSQEQISVMVEKFKDLEEKGIIYHVK